MLRKRHITMIEILLVITMLVMSVGVIGFNIFKAVREQRFLTEVSQVVDELRLAQNLMLIMNTDVRMKIITEGNVNKYWLESDQRVTKSWEREMKRKPKELKYVQFVNFQDELNKDTITGSAEVRFLSGGMVMSRGWMRLSNTTEDVSGALVRYVHLPGHPSPIVSVSEMKELSEVDQDLTEIMKLEVSQDSSQLEAPIDENA